MKSKIKDEVIDKNEVNILMATYNGEKYVSEQIKSIINQSFTNWILLIRDDVSTDNTMKILDKYEKQESRITVIRDDLGNLGQCLNFNEIMKNAKPDLHVMFSDQDDVWLPTKIEESVKEIKRLENIHGTETPILVYTNYNLANDKLDYIKTAYRNDAMKNRECMANKLLIQNWILGCTVIINKKLLEYSNQIPIEAVDHDNWLVLIASMTGYIHYLDKITMLHRLHSNNVTTNLKTTNLFNRIQRVRKRFKRNEEIFDERKCFELLLEQHIRQYIPDFINESLDNYKIMLNMRGIKAILFGIKHKYYGTNTIQTFLFYFQLMLKRKIVN